MKDITNLKIAWDLPLFQGCGEQIDCTSAVYKQR